MTARPELAAEATVFDTLIRSLSEAANYNPNDQVAPAVILGLNGALLQKSIKGGLVIAGSINLGGSVDPIHNAVEITELAIDKGATALLMPVSSRKQLFNLPDDLATKTDIQFYLDAKEALVKSLAD